MSQINRQLFCIFLIFPFNLIQNSLTFDFLLRIGIGQGSEPINNNNNNNNNNNFNNNNVNDPVITDTPAEVNTSVDAVGLKASTAIVASAAVAVMLSIMD